MAGAAPATTRRSAQRPAPGKCALSIRRRTPGKLAVELHNTAHADSILGSTNLRSSQLGVSVAHRWAAGRAYGLWSRSSTPVSGLSRSGGSAGKDIRSATQPWAG